jgi:FkbH-like protein
MTDLLTASLDQLRADAYGHLQPPTLLRARAITQAARTIQPLRADIRLAVVHTYTSDLLDPWLEQAAALEGFGVAVHHAPYGLALGEARAGSELVAFAPDLTLLLLQPGDLDPALAEPVASLTATDRATLGKSAAARMVGFIETFRAQPVGRIVATLLPSPFAPDLGIYDAQSEAGERAWWDDTKRRIATATRALPAVSWLDLDDVLATTGRAAFFDRRTWYSARFPFAPRAASEFARRVISLGIIARRPRVKVIALDADNTLWGGVIGEDGMDAIDLGLDYPGNCYMDFQRRILGLQQRGFILVLCSKNNPADVEQVLREHPHMLLRERHFAASRVNWAPKIDNLNALAEELSVGIESFLLVDDSHYECEAVRRELPQVEVVQTPARAVDVPFCLDHVARLEILALTEEDRGKTAMYAQERERRELKGAMTGGGVNLADYLHSLNMRMTVGFDQPGPLKRLAQLTQKTNQFNLTTRRYEEAEVQAMIDRPDWTVAHFDLSDRFGHSGIVGLALIDRSKSPVARLDTFLMSCRVIGREAEAAFLNAVMRRLAELGCCVLAAEYLPSPKNGLAKDFLAAQGFVSDGEGGWRRDLAVVPSELAEPFLIEIAVAGA